MDLATHQRTLLGLFRGTHRPAPDDDPYVHIVASSPDLVEARRNIFLWRVYVLERACVLTFRLLRRKGLLAAAIGQFIGETNISPFRETQAPAFLEMVATHPDSLVASVAAFELALMRAGDSTMEVGPRGDAHDVAQPSIVDWNVAPHGVLNSLARDLPLDDELEPGSYRIVVSPRLPALFEIHRLS
jgi:hypothetical protein